MYRISIRNGQEIAATRHTMLSRPVPNAQLKAPPVDMCAQLGMSCILHGYSIICITSIYIYMYNCSTSAQIVDGKCSELNASKRFNQSSLSILRNSIIELFDDKHFHIYI